MGKETEKMNRMETERLVFRRWQDRDTPDLYACACDPAVGPIAGWPPHKSPEESLEVIRHVFNGPECYALCLKGKDSPIGCIELKLRDRTDMTDREDECELGYWLGKPCWGKGLMTEAALEMVRHGFEDLGMTRIWCGFYEGNERSKRVQERAGFRYQWTSEDLDVPLMHEKRRGYVSSITRDQWESDRALCSDLNALTVDRWVEEGWEWGKPLSHEEFLKALEGDWQMVLTPVKPVPRTWFPDLKGRRVLGLAAGGGQQMPLFAAAGAVCTVLDYSGKQLESEKEVAVREGYAIDVVRADMTKTLPFEDASFDLIFHPVSNCYIRDVEHVWRECARVLKKGGLLMAGLDNGINFLFGEGDESRISGYLPFDPLKNPDQMEILKREDGGVQFSHTIEEQIGGQLRAGFELLDLYSDTNGSGFLQERGVPCFFATLSRKK